MHDPETIEATTSREPGKGSHATIDMQNARHGQLTRQTKGPDADARRAYLESASFEREGGERFDLSALDEAELDSEPFERDGGLDEGAQRDRDPGVDDSAPFDRADASRFDSAESAPFGRVEKAVVKRNAGAGRARGARFGGGDGAPFEGDSAPFEREISAVFNEGVLDKALAGLDHEKSSRFEVSALRFAVYEDAAYLASAQNAIDQAGHIVALGGAGRDALKRVGDGIRAGGIDVVLVSLPGGESVIDAALEMEPRRPIIIASLSASSVEAVEAATASGADLATTRPHDVERIAPLALAAGRIEVERRAALAAKGVEQVLRQRLEDMADAEPGGLLPFEMFQRVLELEIKRAKRFEYPLSVALFAVEIAPPAPPAGILGILRARAGNALINTIRDIDIATQLDHERFLVLLPYTDLKGAAVVGKRVIGAVAKGQPVISDGRSVPPRVVGAVAGMKKGEPVSFAKLMKDATRALESARRDGAELAVQP
jgi:hypothetical protein